MTNRCNIYSPEAREAGPKLIGWFDMNKATRWSDRDHNGNGSGGTGRGQAVILTASGLWVLENWTNWQGEANSYAYITLAEARDWLLRNGEDDAAEEHFGAVPEEEDRRPGRPPIGEPVQIRLPGDLLAQVDTYAGEHGLSRAETVRVLLSEALNASQPYTVTVCDYATRLREISSRHATLGAAVEALREEQAYDHDALGMPSRSPRVEHDGRPVDVETAR